MVDRGIKRPCGEMSFVETATRDDNAIAKEVYDTKSMDAVYGLTDITLVDELFYFIREQLGLLDKWERIQPTASSGYWYRFITI